MRKAIFVCVIFLASSTVVHADGALTKTICKAGTQVTKSDPVFGDSAAKTISERVSNSNFCSNDKVTLSPLGVVFDAITCICPDKGSAAENAKVLDSVGCEAGQVEPMVTISIKKEISGCKTDEVKISKCSKDPRAAYKAACQSGMTVPASGVGGTDDVTIPPTPWTADELPLLSVPSESQMVGALTATGKISADEASRLATTQPQDVQALIRALASGDQEAIKSSAAQLNIDPGIAANIAKLSPSDIQGSTDQQGATSPTRNNELPAGSTGFNTAAQGGLALPKCGGSDLAAGIAFGESGCGANTANNSPGARGLHGFMCTSWNSFAQSTGYGQYTCPCSSSGSYIGQCPYINDPTIANAVVNKRYDMYQQQYGATCASIGKDWNTCAYLMHFFGEAGFQRMVAVYRNDPNTPMTRATVDSIVQPGAYDSNKNVFLRATTAEGVFAYLNAKLNGANGSSITGYSTPTGYSSNPGYSSPFALVSGSSPAQAPVTASPFANLALFSGLLQQSQQQSQQQTAQPTQQQIVAPPKAVVKLTVTPTVGKAGDSFKVEWQGTAVIPQTCTLTLPGAQAVAVGPEGSQSVKIAKASAYGLIYTCRGIDGTTQIANQTVFVQ